MGNAALLEPLPVGFASINNDVVQICLGFVFWQSLFYKLLSCSWLFWRLFVVYQDVLQGSILAIFANKKDEAYEITIHAEVI